MQKKSKFFPVFFIFLLLSITILGLSLYSMLSGTLPFLEKTTSFVPKTAYKLFQGFPFVSEGKEIERLKNEKLELASRFINQEKLKKENAALLSQFESQDEKVDNLLPAQVVGAPGFIPGVTTPLEFILDRGAKDNVKVGSSVVFKDNLIGKVTKVSYYLSKIALVIHPSVVFPAETVNGAAGIIMGEGENKMTLGNVLPSENLKIDDLVLTKGDVDINGIGTAPNLIVGKIQSIEKIPTAVFQKAEVISLIDFHRLSIVFIVVERK